MDYDRRVLGIDPATGRTLFEQIEGESRRYVEVDPSTGERDLGSDPAEASRRFFEGR